MSRIVTYLKRPISRNDFPRIKQEIDAALSTVPVEPATWGRLKKLY